MLRKDTQEGTPELAYFLNKGKASSCVGSNILNRQLEHKYLLYTRANSCVDRLKAEGSRDSASWLILYKMPQVRTMHDKAGRA